MNEATLKLLFCVAGDNRNIRLLDTSYAKVMNLLQSHNDITFIASVRQEPLNVGTLFSLSEGFTRYRRLSFFRYLNFWGFFGTASLAPRRRLMTGILRVNY